VSTRPLVQRVRRIGLLAGALAFLCQVMAWTLLMPAAAVQAAMVPICTAEGLILAAVDESGTPVSDPRGGEEPGKGTTAAMACPLCPLIAGMALPPVPPSDPLPAEIHRRSPQALPSAFVASGWFLSGIQARAPPAA